MMTDVDISPVWHISPVHPAAQVHVYEPCVLTQVAPLLQPWPPVSHSSISENKPPNHEPEQYFVHVSSYATGICQMFIEMVCCRIVILDSSNLFMISFFRISIIKIIMFMDSLTLWPRSALNFNPGTHAHAYELCVFTNVICWNNWDFSQQSMMYGDPGDCYVITPIKLMFH